MASKCGVTCPRGSGSQVAWPDVASKRGVTCPRGVRDVASKRGVTCPRRQGARGASLDVASKSGVTCPRGVREPGGVARRGVKTWRHLPTWRQDWEPGGVAGRGVKMWRHLPTWRQGARWCGDTCLRGVRGHVRSPELCQRSREWPHLASLGHVASGSHTWRQNVASGAIDLRGVTGRGVKTWRHEARPPSTCLQNVSSVVGRYVHPHRRPP